MWPAIILGILGIGVATKVEAKMKEPTFQPPLPRYLTAAQLIPYIEQVRRTIGLPYTNDAILAVCKVESGSYKTPNAKFDRKSYRYEPHLGTASYGVMQVLETTARDMGLKGAPEIMYDPYWGIYYGVKYLKWVRDYLEPRIGRTPTVAEVLMAYNGGVGTFLRNRKGTPATRQYVAKYEAALDLANRGLA